MVDASTATMPIEHIRIAHDATCEITAILNMLVRELETRLKEDNDSLALRALALRASVLNEAITSITVGSMDPACLEASEVIHISNVVYYGTQLDRESQFYVPVREGDGASHA